MAFEAIVFTGFTTRARGRAYREWRPLPGLVDLQAGSGKDARFTK